MRRLIRDSFCLLMLIFIPAGCGESGPPGSAGGDKPAVASRPGEDTMKDAMDKLIKSGKAVPGVSKTTVKH